MGNGSICEGSANTTRCLIQGSEIFRDLPLEFGRLKTKGTQTACVVDSAIQINLKLLQENQGDVAVVLRLLQGDDLNATTQSEAAGRSSAVLPGGSQGDAEAFGEPNWV